MSLEWLINGPDSDEVPFLQKPQAAPAPEVTEPNRNLYKFQVNADHDEWTNAAIAIMQELDNGQRQAMVAKMREYKQFLGPPDIGQTLSMAVK